MARKNSAVCVSKSHLREDVREAKAFLRLLAQGRARCAKIKKIEKDIRDGIKRDERALRSHGKRC